MTSPSDPVPPVNVQLVLDDDTRIPVDLVYVGRQYGLDRWEVATAVDRNRVRGLTCDQLPAHTSVAFPWHPGPGGKEGP